VTYNKAGDEYRGALVIYDYTLDPVNSTLTVDNAMEFTNSDINGAAAIPHGADSYEIFLVGSTIGYPGSGLSTPAFLIYFDATLTNYDLLDLPGYTANSISYQTGESWFSVSSGSNGGLTLLDRSTILSGAYLTKSNLTSVFNSGDYVYQFCTDPCGLGKFRKSTLSDQVFPLVGYSSDHLEKSSVEVKYGHTFIALNEGGTVVWNNSTDVETDNLVPADPGGVPADYLVSNGLCVGDYRLFIANGGGGLTISELDLDMNINPIGNVFTGQSVNDVVMLQEGGNSGYLALVSGKAGVEIVYYTYSGTAPTLTTSAPGGIAETTAESGGNITNNGGTVVSEKGVCWSTSQNPTTADSRTTDGTGSGVFTSSMTGLTSGVSYFVRAYATNNVGTSYGNQENFTTTASWTCGDPFTDIRDGNSYTTILIGTQCWMSKNMAYLPSVNPSSTGSDTNPHFYVNGYEGSDVATAKAAANYTNYGALYNWSAAMNGDAASNSVPSGVQGICPDGWYLPSKDEWQLLITYLTDNGYGYGGSGDDIGKALASTTSWNTSTDAGAVGNTQSSNNASGFSAPSAGSRYYTTGFNAPGERINFKSSSEDWAGMSSWSVGLWYRGDGFTFHNGKNEGGGSVRCIKN
jgi:uncharacterized protein (TIGR02145 family)